MPTTYAHDIFGEKVYRKLDPQLKKIIEKEKAIFRIGLHGPDILFYYEPYHKNAIFSMGGRLHHETAAEFFMRGKQLYLESGDEKVLSYLMGFICHFMLDSTCHPEVRRFEELTGASHDEIETELDRALMLRNGKNPFKYRPGNHIRPESAQVEVIRDVIGDISSSEIRKCLKGMRFYTSITVGSAVKRKILLNGAKLVHCYDLVEGRIMRKKRSARCEESNRVLLKGFELAIPETVTVMEEFYRDIQDQKKINSRFYQNYG